jgi:hypothetical protein
MKNLKYILITASIFAIDILKSKNEQKDEVLATLEGKPLITKSQSEETIQYLIKSNPQVEQILAFSPGIKVHIFENLAREKIINHWGIVNKKDQTESYKQKLEKAIEQLKSQIMVNEFDESILSQIDTSDKILEEYYKKNQTKNSIIYRKPFLKLEDHVKADYVEFADEKSAKSFYEKVKKDSSKFKSFAKEINKDVQEISISNKNNMPSPLIKSKLKEMKVSEVELINSEKDKHIVLYAKESIKAEWAPFKDVKEELKKVYMQNEYHNLLDKTLDKLKAEYKFNDENAKKLFEKEQEKQEESIKKMQEELEKMQKNENTKNSKKDNEKKESKK